MSSWLDIAIGVAGVWFLLAVFVSAINELIVRILALRSKQLWAALAQILDGERGRPVLANLVHLPFEQARPKNPDPGQDATQVERLYATAAVQALENRPDAGTSTRIGHLPAPVFAQSVVEMATKASATGESIDDWVASLPDTSPIKHGLKALLVTSQGDLNKFRDGVERVFDAQMARVSAIYRAQVRVITLGLAVVVGVGAFGAGMRVDALRLVSDLQRNQNLSAAYASAGSTLSSTDLGGLAAAGCPSGSASATPATGGAAAPVDFACVAEGFGHAQGLNLVFTPLSDDGGATLGDRMAQLWPPQQAWRVWFGLIVTIGAISLGAPFWYDALRRLVGLRKPGGSTADNG